MVQNSFIDHKAQTETALFCLGSQVIISLPGNNQSPSSHSSCSYLQFHLIKSSHKQGRIPLLVCHHLLPYLAIKLSRVDCCLDSTVLGLSGYFPVPVFVRLPVSLSIHSLSLSHTLTATSLHNIICIHVKHAKQIPHNIRST